MASGRSCRIAVRTSTSRALSCNGVKGVRGRMGRFRPPRRRPRADDCGGANAAHRDAHLACQRRLMLMGERAAPPAGEALSSKAWTRLDIPVETAPATTRLPALASRARHQSRTGDAAVAPTASAKSRASESHTISHGFHHVAAPTPSQPWRIRRRSPWRGIRRRRPRDSQPIAPTGGCQSSRGSQGFPASILHPRP